MKYNFTNSQKLLIYLVISLRLIVPFSIFKFGLWGVLASILADWIDFDTLLLGNIRVDQPKLTPYYQKFDKALDSFYLTFIAILVLNKFSHPISTICLVLYIYRMLGFILFEITKNRKFFVIAPNFFENFCLVILFFSKFSLEINYKSLFLPVLLSFIVKMLQEIFIHGTNLIPKYSVDVKMVNGIRKIFGRKPY